MCVGSNTHCSLGSDEWHRKTGSASWMDALGRYFAQNVGKSPVRIILVEIKGAS